MTTKKTLALLSVLAVFLANAFGIQSATSTFSPLIVTAITSLCLFVTVLSISKNALIATASALWWLSVCLSSILLPLSLVLRDVWFDLGLTGFLCLLFGLLFGYIGFVLWYALPWDPAVEELR